MTKPLRLPTGAPPSRRNFAQGLPKVEERPSEMLDPEVLERYLLLLSLEVESQRIIEENRRAMEEIDRARDEANARIKAASQG